MWTNSCSHKENSSIRPQEATNVRNLRKRYVNYKRLSELRIRIIRKDIEEENEEPRDSPTLIAHIIVSGVKPVQPIFITKRWIVDPLDPSTYKRLVNASGSATSGYHCENRLEPIRTNGIRATRDTDDSVDLRIIVHDFSEMHNIS